MILHNLMFNIVYYIIDKTFSMYTIAIAGGRHYLTSHSDDVLQYDEVAGEWRSIGRMTVARQQHGVSVINFNEIKDYCN